MTATATTTVLPPRRGTRTARASTATMETATASTRTVPRTTTRARIATEATGATTTPTPRREGTSTTPTSTVTMETATRITRTAAAGPCAGWAGSYGGAAARRRTTNTRPASIATETTATRTTTMGQTATPRATIMTRTRATGTTTEAPRATTTATATRAGRSSWRRRAGPCRLLGGTQASLRLQHARVHSNIRGVPDRAGPRRSVENGTVTAEGAYTLTVSSEAGHVVFGVVARRARRAATALTPPDRAAFLAAVVTLYTTPAAEGRKRYGDAFRTMDERARRVGMVSQLDASAGGPRRRARRDLDPRVQGRPTSADCPRCRGLAGGSALSVDPPPRNIHAAAAASPRLVLAEYVAAPPRSPGTTRERGAGSGPRTRCSAATASPTNCWAAPSAPTPPRACWRSPSRTACRRRRAARTATVSRPGRETTVAFEMPFLCARRGAGVLL